MSDELSTALICLFYAAVFVAGICGIYKMVVPKPCSTPSIYNHNTYICGSMHRVCQNCGAEFDADYFEARQYGGNVMQYYHMTKAGKAA